jgi:hypothetical protein
MIAAPLVGALLALSAFASSPARAAESYDACAGTITSLPAVIATQGVWCMKQDLSTAQTSGIAISVQVNNVTIDCNGFKLGGLSAGVTTQTVGIQATNGAANMTVRNCNVRGFLRGIYGDYTGGSGHIIEDNRVDGSTLVGIMAMGDGSIVRRNIVTDVGGSVGYGNTITGISVYDDADVIDNTVRGVSGDPAQAGFAFGITHNNGTSGVVAGNRVGGIVRSPTGTERQIHIDSTNVIVRDNSLTSLHSSAFGVACDDASSSAFDNATTGPGGILSGCYNAGGNTSP